MAKRWEELSATAEPKQAVRYVLAARLVKLASHAERISKDKGEVAADSVHQVRVYCRRVQSALDVLGEFVPPKHAKRIHRTLHKLRRAAGRVRDWDVLSVELGNIRDQAPPGEQLAIDHLLDQYRQRRAEGLEKLTRRARRIDRKDFWDWVAKHYPSSLTVEDVPAAEEDEQSLGRLAIEKIHQELEIFERASQNYRTGDVEQLHLLRLAVKRFRYVLEVFAGCLGPNFRSAIYQPVARWQESLGAINDAHEFSLRFDRLAKEASEDDVVRSLIAVRDRYSRQLEQAASQFREGWSDDDRNQVAREIRSALGMAEECPESTNGPPADSNPLVANPDSD
jgi:CHAD domain-containing protein